MFIHRSCPKRTSNTPSCPTLNAIKPVSIPPPHFLPFTSYPSLCRQRRRRRLRTPTRRRRRRRSLLHHLPNTIVSLALTNHRTAVAQSPRMSLPVSRHLRPRHLRVLAGITQIVCEHTLLILARINPWSHPQIIASSQNLRGLSRHPAQPGHWRWRHIPAVRRRLEGGRAPCQRVRTCGSVEVETGTFKAR